VDLTDMLSEFIDEMLGLHSAYALTDIESFDGPGDTAAFVRLRVRLCEALLADGWTPNPDAAQQLDRDRQLCLAATVGDDEHGTPSDHEERAVMRARAARVRDEARRTSEKAGAQRRAREDNHDEIEQMRQALASRAVIEQAKGIAMERYGLSADVAWSWLVRTSQNRNVKLRAIAEELVESVAASAQSDGSGSPAAGSSRPSPSSVPTVPASTPAVSTPSA
jgi:hypothetical protein